MAIKDTGGIGREKRTEGIGREKRTEGIGREKRTEGIGREKRTGEIGREKRTEGIGREKRTEGIGREKRTEGIGGKRGTEGIGREKRTGEIGREKRTGGIGGKRGTGGIGGEKGTGGIGGKKGTRRIGGEKGTEGIGGEKGTEGIGGEKRTGGIGGKRGTEGIGREKSTGEIGGRNRRTGRQGVRLKKNPPRGKNAFPWPTFLGTRDKRQRFVKHHLLPLSFFLFLAIFAFRKLIGTDGIILNADLTKPPELDHFWNFFYPMWSSYESISNISRIYQLPFYLPFFALGFALDLTTTQLLVVVFVFVEFLAGASMYYASRYVLSRTYGKDNRYILWGALVAAVSYMWSPYVVFRTFHPMIRVGLALGPLVALALILALERKKARYFIAAGFLWCVACADLHWVFFGALLLLSMSLAYLVLDIYHWDVPASRNIFGRGAGGGKKPDWGAEREKGQDWGAERGKGQDRGAEREKGQDWEAEREKGQDWEAEREKGQDWGTEGGKGSDRATDEKPYQEEPGRLRSLGRIMMARGLHFLGLLFIFFGFAAFWIIPGVGMGGASLYGVSLTSDSLTRMNVGKSTVLDMVGKQGVHHMSDDMFLAEGFLGTPLMQDILFVMGFTLFILAFSSLFLRPRNRYVIYFSLLALVSIFLSAMIDLAPDLSIWIIQDAPFANWYGWVFKTPKISQLILLSLSFMIGFTMIELLIRLDRSRTIDGMPRRGSVRWRRMLPKVIRHGTVVLVLSCLMLPNWPIGTGDMNGLLEPTDLPDEFDRVNHWLIDQEGDFKVLWLPKYASRDVDWNPGRRTTMDLAALTTSRPTYIFDTPHRAHYTGIYYLESLFSDNTYSSMVLGNTTSSLGEMLTPLGVKYIVYHDDNATKKDRGQGIYENLFVQDDIEYVRSFGFIHLFENTNFTDLGPHESLRVSAPGKTDLLFGGLAFQSTLALSPGNGPADNGVLFAHQTHYNGDDLSKMVDRLVFPASLPLDDVALSMVDGSRFLAPVDFTQSESGGNEWARKLTSDTRFLVSSRQGRNDAWEWDFDHNSVQTWSPGTVKEDLTTSETHLVDYFDFETDQQAFSTWMDGMVLYRGNNSYEGDGCLMGYMQQADYRNDISVSNGLRDIPMGDNRARFVTHLAAQDVGNVQMKIKFYDANRQPAGAEFMLTETGTFDYRRYESDMLIPTTARYYSVFILSNPNPITSSRWMLDNFRFYTLRNHTVPNRLDIDFDVDDPGQHRIYVRALENDMGGELQVYLDGNVLDRLMTKGRLNAYRWFDLGQHDLSSGGHQLTLDNVAEFNLVNVFAVVPRDEMEQKLELARSLVQTKDITYVMEAEDVFHPANNTISDINGNLASLKETIMINRASNATLPVEILREGSYNVWVRLPRGDQAGYLSLTVGGDTTTLPSQEHEGFAWVLVPDVALDEGPNQLEFSTKRDDELIYFESFEDGMDQNLSSPKGWSQPHRRFNASLDFNNPTDGSACLNITSRMDRNLPLSGMVSGAVAVKSGDYLWSMDIATRNLREMKVILQGFNTDNGSWENITALVDVFAGESEWTGYSGGFSLAENISEIRLRVDSSGRVDSQMGQSAVKLDNIRIYRDLVEAQVQVDSVMLELKQAANISTGPAPVLLEVDDRKVESLTVRVRSDGPFMLCLTEAFDGFWVARVEGGDTVKAIPYHGMLNGFFIEESGNLTIHLEYRPHRLFITGATVSVMVSLASLAFLLLTTRRSWGKRLLKLMEREEKNRSGRGVGNDGPVADTKHNNGTTGGAWVSERTRGKKTTRSSKRPGGGGT